MSVWFHVVFYNNRPCGENHEWRKIRWPWEKYLPLISSCTLQFNLYMVQWSFWLISHKGWCFFFRRIITSIFSPQTKDQSDFKQWFLDRVNTIKNYNCIKLYELNNTQNHVYLLDKYSVLYTCIHNLSGLEVKPLCVWACIPLSVEPTQWPTLFYFIPYYITSLSHLITLLRGHF